MSVAAAPRTIPPSLKALLDLRRYLETALAVLDYAIQSPIPDEHEAAQKIVLGDLRRVCK